MLVTQWFAPTTLRLTFETEGQGALTPEQLEDLVVRDAHGRVIKLNLPQQTVMISNHQVRSGRSACGQMLIGSA